MGSTWGFFANQSRTHLRSIHQNAERGWRVRGFVRPKEMLCEQSHHRRQGQCFRPDDHRQELLNLVSGISSQRCRNDYLTASVAPAFKTNVIQKVNVKLIKGNTE